MQTPVQDIIIGNIPGARGTDTIFDDEHDWKRVSNTLTTDVKVNFQSINSFRASLTNSLLIYQCKLNFA